MSNIILYIIVLFSVLGAIDKLLDNRFGLGDKFTEGFKSIGSLGISMIGIISLAPVIARVLTPLLIPISETTGVDPSIFISSLLAVDLGGYSTSIEIANSLELAYFSGLILASILGVVVSFSIPVAITVIKKDDLQFFAQGALAGIITIPIGVFIGGILMGLPIYTVLINLAPIILLSIIIAIALIKYERKTIFAFTIFGKIILYISIIGLIFSLIDFVLGVKIIEGTMAFEEGLIIAGKVGVILSGTLPLLETISRLLGIKNKTSLGILSTMANIVPTYALLEDMDDKGKVINIAFAMSGAFVLGGQIGFVASISLEMIMPFIVSKIAGGISGVILAMFLWNKKNNKRSECLNEG